MKAILIVLLLAVAALASKKDFLEFQHKYNKVYATTEEFQKRYLIFEENMRKAKELTIRNNGSAQFGATKFSDLSSEEFASFYLMKNFKRNAHKLPKLAIKPRGPGAPDPTNYDWNSAGIITPVYNQEQCGSCWAFSATETIESYFALSGGQLQQLSMQQIVDCDTQDSGCNGGIPANAYGYVNGAGGLETYGAYPYAAQQENCQYQQDQVVQGTGNFQYGSIDGEDGLYQQASSTGPVSVCVDASSWQNYQGGVLTDCGDSIDHCVQLTGYYNYGSSQAYWNVRNSWGTDWGNSGYIWIAIGSDLCGIGDEATALNFS